MGFCPWMLHVFCDLCQLVTTAGIGHAHEASRRNLFPRSVGSPSTLHRREKKAIGQQLEMWLGGIF